MLHQAWSSSGKQSRACPIKMDVTWETWYLIKGLQRYRDLTAILVNEKIQKVISWRELL